MDHKKALFLLLMICLLTATGKAQRPQPPGTQAAPHVSVEGLLWKTRQIPVCWLNPESDVRSQRKLVIQAINDSWAKYVGREFQWNEKCQPISKVSSPEIRILINLGPVRSSSSIGTINWSKSNEKWTFAKSPQDGVETSSNAEWETFTMYLGLGHFYPEVAEKQGLRFTAIHEFGHALGFLHEQTANNVPQSCIDMLPSMGGRKDERKICEDAYGSYGIVFTNYDADSIMNYCRPNLLKDELSAQDIVAVQSIYPRTEQTVRNFGEYFTISDTAQQTCLTVSGSSLVQMSTCASAAENQLWAFAENADHSFVIRPKGDANKSLTISSDAIQKIVSGALKTKYEEIVPTLGVNQGSASNWFRTPTKNDAFILQLSLSGFVLDRDTWDESRKKVILYKNWRGDNQVWKVTKALGDAKAPKRN